MVCATCHVCSCLTHTWDSGELVHRPVLGPHLEPSGHVHVCVSVAVQHPRRLASAVAILLCSVLRAAGDLIPGPCPSSHMHSVA